MSNSHILRPARKTQRSTVAPEVPTWPPELVCELHAAKLSGATPEQMDDILQRATGCRFGTPAICTPIRHDDCHKEA